MLLEAIATITGTIIGAGILGMPYAISKSGLLIGIFWLILIYIIMLLLHLMVGEITLRNKEIHQIPGYAKKYLGNKGYILMLLSNLVGMYGAIVSYLIAQARSYNVLFNINPYIVMILLSVALLYFLWKGINLIKYVESGIALLVYTILLGTPIALFSVLKPDLSALYKINLKYIFYPFGSIVFAYIGFVSIPEVREILKNKPRLIKKAITIGTTIPLLLYLIYTTSIILTIKNVPEISTYIFGSLGIFFTILLTTAPLFTLSFGIKSIFNYDIGIKKSYSVILTAVPPLIISSLIYSVNEAFIKAISITGSLTFMIVGPLLMIMHLKSKKIFDRNPEYEINLPKIFYIVASSLFIVSPLLEFLR